MKKGADAFRSIGEVAKLIGVAPHVLRYWETQFSQLKPMKRPDGRRYYRPEDVRLAAGLCEILREEGLTIRGARKMLARDRGEAVRARGADRLGGLLGAAQAQSPAVAMAEAEMSPATADCVEQASLTVPATLATADPDLLADEDLQDMPPHSPRSRHRARRRPGTAATDPLPLFPDLDSRPAGATWLANLLALSSGLRGLDDSDPRLGQARPHLSALRNAIAGLY